MDYSSELSCALETAKTAGRFVLSSQTSLPGIEVKADLSPVTAIDRKSETIIREGLLSAFRSDGFLGEETPETPGTSGRRWIVDPLDGTRPYLHGIPTYSVLIALEDNGELVAGVIHLPALNLTCWASIGCGAWLNGDRICVSTCTHSRNALGTGLGFVERAQEDAGKQLLALMRSWDYAYGFMDAYSYVCVASGRLDIAVNILDKPWDCASAACIVREAGGAYSDIYGERTVHNGSIILSNGAIHGEAVRGFSKSDCQAL
ncbi:MAG: inositol monophosphatase [Chitinispirillaceae bacterium]|nr:inositol monophosphatase [Chitinispirillaceae bacterium]